jgi:23S rRNA-/tRNA-specific pseudouridylate synthase
MIDEKVIIYEDESIVVVDKPPGILTVPTPKMNNIPLLIV